jgi:hypothetical protein
MMTTASSASAANCVMASRTLLSKMAAIFGLFFKQRPNAPCAPRESVPDNCDKFKQEFVNAGITF